MTEKQEEHIIRIGMAAPLWIVSAIWIMLTVYYYRDLSLNPHSNVEQQMLIVAQMFTIIFAVLHLLGGAYFYFSKYSSRPYE